MEELRAVIRN